MGTYNIAYSIPYVLCLFCFTGLAFWEFRALKYERSTDGVRILTIALYLLFFGLRGFIFTDWYQYYYVFEKLPTIWDSGIAGLANDAALEFYATDETLGVSGLEPGFLYFSIFLKSIVPNYFFWIFINTVLDVWMLSVFVKRYSSYYALSFLLFFVFGGLTIQINLMRNIKALFLFLLSLKYIEERRPILYFLFNAVGMLFHSTSILFFPLYFFLHRKFQTKWLWAILGLGIVVVLFQIQFVKPIVLQMADIIGGRLGVQIKIYFALDFYSKSYGLSMGFVERAFTYMILVLNYNRLIEQKKSNVLFINAFIIYFIVNSYLNEVFIIVDRVSMLFIFAYWILYAELILMVKDTLNKWIWFSLMMAYGAMKLVVMNSNIFSKYDNLLFGIESFEERSQTRYHEKDNFMFVE